MRSGPADREVSALVREGLPGLQSRHDLQPFIEELGPDAATSRTDQPELRAGGSPAPAEDDTLAAEQVQTW